MSFWEFFQNVQRIVKFEGVEWKYNNYEVKYINDWILLDGIVTMLMTTMTAITNGRCFGSGFWVCPDAQVDAGLLDLMVTQSIGRIKILRLIPKIMKGTHVNESILKNYRARRVVIKSQQ